MFSPPASGIHRKRRPLFQGRTFPTRLSEETSLALSRGLQKGFPSAELHAIKLNAIHTIPKKENAGDDQNLTISLRGTHLSCSHVELDDAEHAHLVAFTARPMPAIAYSSQLEYLETPWDSVHVA